MNRPSFARLQVFDRCGTLVLSGWPCSLKAEANVSRGPWQIAASAKTEPAFHLFYYNRAITGMRKVIQRIINEKRPQEARPYYGRWFRQDEKAGLTCTAPF